MPGDSKPHLRDVTRRRFSSGADLGQPGKLVSLRGREWVVLPSDDPDLLVVKPLGGSDKEITGIYLPLGIAADRPTDARFEPPSADDLGPEQWAILVVRSSRQFTIASLKLSSPLRSKAPSNSFVTIPYAPSKAKEAALRASRRR
jgi:hypothetical protein